MGIAIKQSGKDAGSRSVIESRVLMVVRWPVGGIRTYLRTMLTHPAFADMSFTVLLADGTEARGLIADLGSSSKIRWIVVPSSTRSLGFRCLRELIVGGYGLVHAHGATAGMIAAWPARLLGKPTLTTLHEVLTAGQFSGWLGPLRRRIVECLLRGCRHIHAVSEDAFKNVAEYLPGLLRSQGRVRVIRHGIDVQSFQAASPRDLREELATTPECFLLGYFGRFMAPKGFRILISAVERIREARSPDQLQVVCLGSGGFVKEDRQNLESRGLGAYFRFLPAVNHLGSTIKGVNAVVMPSLWEASGLLAMESMVCGVPLIATDCIGLRETIANTPARMVTAGDPRGLADAVSEEMEHPRTVDAQDFAQQAAQRFDANIAFGSLRRLYSETAGVTSH